MFVREATEAAGVRYVVRLPRDATQALIDVIFTRV